MGLGMDFIDGYEVLYQREEASNLRAALRNLSAKPRAALMLKYVHDLSLPEIAGWLGYSSRERARQLIQIALRKLRFRMRDSEPPYCLSLLTVADGDKAKKRIGTPIQGPIREYKKPVHRRPKKKAEDTGELALLTKLLENTFDMGRRLFHEGRRVTALRIHPETLKKLQNYGLATIGSNPRLKDCPDTKIEKTTLTEPMHIQVGSIAFMQMLQDPFQAFDAIKCGSGWD
jgi:hypothetical protein